MTRDSSASYLHLHSPRIADLFEEFTRTHLAPEEIFVPPHHQPVNPEDEDDVVPDQHAAFGITRATAAKKEPAWKDLGLKELFEGEKKKGLGKSEGKVLNRHGEGEFGVVLRRKGVAGSGNAGNGMPR